jgi:AcrR family transcriptional regulator
MAETQTATQPPRRTAGRPPLTESRKDEIRLTISTAAVRLFTEQGLDGTSVAQIADAAGIATRTLWRYFPSKEACAGPLLSFGLDRFASYVRNWPTDRPLAEAADDTAWFSDTSPTRLLLVIDLLRLTHTEPLLDGIWTRCYSEAVAPLSVVLGDRLGLPADDLRVRVKASMLLASMHQAMRHYVCRAPGEHGLSLEDTIRAAARIGLAAAEAPDV